MQAEVLQFLYPCLKISIVWSLQLHWPMIKTSRPHSSIWSSSTRTSLTTRKCSSCSRIAWKDICLISCKREAYLFWWQLPVFCASSFSSIFHPEWFVNPNLDNSALTDSIFERSEGRQHGFVFNPEGQMVIPFYHHYGWKCLINSTNLNKIISKFLLQKLNQSPKTWVA